MEIECYICEGYGTWSDGTKCPSCQGSGEMKIELPERDAEYWKQEAEFLKAIHGEDCVIG
jgi:hypothetical protein